METPEVVYVYYKDAELQVYDPELYTTGPSDTPYSRLSSDCLADVLKVLRFHNKDATLSIEDQKVVITL